MKSKVIYAPVLLAFFFNHLAAAHHPLNAQEKPKPPAQTKPASSRTDETDLQNQIRRQLMTRIGEVLRATAENSKQWKDAAVAANAQAQIADLLWESEPETARSYLTQAWTTASHVEEAKQERSRFRNESARDSVRRDVLLVARRRAPDLAKQWLTQMAQEAEDERDSQPRGVFDDRTARSTVLLQMALQTADNDPQAASDLAVESLQDGISFGLQQVLAKLQEKSFDLAQKVFHAALSRVQMSGLSDPNELLILSSYLYTPGQIMAANTGDNRGSRQLAISQNRPHIAAAASLNPALALEFLNVAADVLLNTPLPAATGDPQATARAQLSVISSLLTEMSRQLPEKAAALQSRARQIETDAHFSTVPASPRADLPAPVAGETSAGYADRRVDLLEKAAENETYQLGRDIAYAKAALATTVERYERGLSLAGKIDDETLRAGVKNWLLYRAALNLIKAGDANQASELNAKNTDPLQRAAVLVMGAQKFVKDKDLIHARQWLDEARALVGKADADDNRLRIAFGIVAAYSQVDKLMTLQSLSEAVHLLDQTSTVSNDERAPLVKRFSGITTLADFTYGTNGFGLKAAIKAFAPDQFEDVLYILNNIPSPEARGTAIIALCQEYLQAKLRKPEKAPGSPVVKSS